MSKETYERKMQYVRKLASIEGVHLNMYRWASALDWYYSSIGLNVSFRFLLNMYMTLDFHTDPSNFDWHNVDWWNMFTPAFEKVPVLDAETSAWLERLFWNVRYWATEKDIPYWKLAGIALKEKMKIAKDILIQRGFSEYFVDMMEEKVALVEGKLSITSYVGFAVVGLSKVYDRWGLKVRNPANWTEELTLETVAMYESHVGFARVDHSRVTGSPQPKKELADHFAGQIEGFRKRVGEVTASPEVLTYYQRIFWWRKTDKMHRHGGYHQVRLQSLARDIRPILDSAGIIASMRGLYISFANELFYLTYEPHRYWKRWKKQLTEPELLEKYIKYGCDKNILEKIKRVVKG